MSRNIEFSIGEYYHLYNRGTDKRKIFNNTRDYERFRGLLYMCNNTESMHIVVANWSLDNLFETPRADSLIDIGAYCLMPNHLHLLVKEKVENGISKFMQKLLTAYTMYYNRKYNRSGALFQGRFKARHADDDEYLKYIFSYIHLNPVKLIEPLWKETGIKEKEKAYSFLKKYDHSSFLDFLGRNRIDKIIIKKDAFPEYFQNSLEFEAIVKDWLNYENTPV